MTTTTTAEALPIAQTYLHDAQPTYANPKGVLEAQAELRTMEGVTTPERIRQFRRQLGRVAMGTYAASIIISGNCMRRIVATEDIHDIANEVETQQRIVYNILPEVISISRDFNQDKKPRTEQYEKDASGDFVLDKNGEKIPSYYGDGINSKEHREPDETRMVAGAIQSRDVMEIIDNKPITAHEALLIPFEESFKRIDDDKTYIVSGDLLWVGDRTRHLNSPQIELLKNVENPIGIKIGPTTNPDDIKLLYNTLNPDKLPGKIVFMLRLGVDNLDKINPLLKAIKEDAPDSIIMCDPMHGNTVKTEINGKQAKTRRLSDMIREIIATKIACDLAGLQLHGLHLEASGRDERKECVKNKNDKPTHISNLDPELNNTQLAQILRVFKEITKR